jgi:hypothetical protein
VSAFLLGILLILSDFWALPLIFGLFLITSFNSPTHVQNLSVRGESQNPGGFEG